MMSQQTNHSQRQGKGPLFTILSVMLLVAVSSYFFTTWPYRGLILFVAFPLGLILAVLVYYSKGRGASRRLERREERTNA